MLKRYNFILFFSLLLFTSQKLLSFQTAEIFDYKTYIEKFGYTLEEHYTTTTDGYILSLWHLVEKSSTIKKTKAIMLQHGLVDTSWCFFQLKKNSLPFLLMKKNYDVWIPNIRGNHFSLGHKTKNSKDLLSDYWQFSMDEHVKYDIPAFVTYIKKKTGLNKIDYIGHSQGTTIFFMKYMDDPKFVENNFNHFIALAPVPNIANTFLGPNKLIDILADGIKKIYPLGDILQIPNNIRLIIVKFCKLFPNVLKGFMEKAAGTHATGRTDYKDVYNYLYYYPSSTSKQNLLQWAQISKNKKLVYYSNDNTVKEYDLNNVKNWKVKALLVRSDSDSLSSYTDVTDFYDSLSDKSNVNLLSVSDYNHLDVLTAESAISEIYAEVLNFLNK